MKEFGFTAAREFTQDGKSMVEVPNLGTFTAEEWKQMQSLQLDPQLKAEMLGRHTPTTDLDALMVKTEADIKAANRQAGDSIVQALQDSNS